MKYLKIHSDLPSHDERLEMAKFVHARKGYEIEWLLKNVYKLMAIYKRERKGLDDQTVKYFAKKALEEESKTDSRPKFIIIDGISHVLNDLGQYEEILD